MSDKPRRNNSALYGVFYVDPATGRPCWGLRTNRRRAVSAARAHKGQVRVIPNGMSRGIWGSVTSWDAPTFRVTSDLVADFREAQ